MNKIKIGLLIALVLLGTFIIDTNVVLADESASETDKMGKTEVKVTGQAHIEDDVGQAKKKALEDAFRNALEKVLGTKITAATVMEDLQITSDVVISQTWGNLLSYKVLREWEEDGTYNVSIFAVVSSDAQWWEDFKGGLDVSRLHVKDLVLRESYDIPGLVQSGALFQDPLVVTPLRDIDNNLAAIHSETKQILWTKKLKNRITAPLAANDKWLYAVTREDLVALNLQYGWVKWRFPLKETVFHPPAISDNTVYITTRKGRLLAIDMKKGNLLWQYQTPGYMLTAPKISGNKLFFGDDSGYLHALDLNRESRLFKKKISSDLKASPTPTRILTYLSWTDNHDRISAVNTNTGEEIWSFEGGTSSNNTLILSPYLVDGKLLTIFINSRESRIYLLDAKTGHKYWEKELSLPVTEIAGAGDGLIFLNTWEGIRVLEMEFGSQLWSNRASGLKTQLLVGEDRLFYLHQRTMDIFK